MSRGHDRERDVAKLLDSWGWLVVRSAGSLGPVDLVALSGYRDWRWGPRPVPPQITNRLLPVLLIEVKSTAKSPFEQFGPADRAELGRLAAKGGAIPVLAYWPPCKPGESKAHALRWIWENEWPR